MAKILKKVDRGIPSGNRSQSFTSADAVEDDILLVRDSLGHPASHVKINAFSGDLTVRFNVLRTVYSDRSLDTFFANGGGMWPNLTTGVELTSAGVNEQTIAASETYELNNEFAVEDIHLLTVSGTFSIYVC
jgi:hypothetical protein